MPLRLCSMRHHAAISVFSYSTYRANTPPIAASLLCRHHAFSAQSLTACAPFYYAHPVSLRPAPGTLLCRRYFATPALCHYLSIWLLFFFTIFFFPCGSTLSLKSAFIIGDTSQSKFRLRNSKPTSWILSHSGSLDGDSAPHTLGWHILTDMQIGSRYTVAAG